MTNGSAMDRGIQSAKQIVSEGLSPFDREQCKRDAVELLNRSETAMVGSNGASGYPNIKAMFKISSEQLHTVWFSTLSSSRRVSQFKENPKACVYVFDSNRFAGLLLVGDIEIVQDSEAKKRLWREGWEAYYPLGANDPEYCLLKFSAHWGNYYHGLQNSSFQIEQNGGG